MSGSLTVSVVTSTTALMSLLFWLDMDSPWKNDALRGIWFIWEGRIDEYISLDNVDGMVLCWGEATATPASPSPHWSSLMRHPQTTYSPPTC